MNVCGMAKYVWAQVSLKARGELQIPESCSYRQRNTSLRVLENWMMVLLKGRASCWAVSPEPPLPTIVFSSIRAHSRILIPRKWAYLPLPSSNCHSRADLTFPPMGLTWSYWSLSSTWSLLCKCLCNSSRWEVLTWPRSLCTDSSATNPSCSW